MAQCARSLFLVGSILYPIGGYVFFFKILRLIAVGGCGLFPLCRLRVVDGFLDCGFLWWVCKSLSCSAICGGYVVLRIGSKVVGGANLVE